MTLSPVTKLATALIRLPSVTPDDAGCQALMAARLEALGFEVEQLNFGDVTNFWAVRGEQGPILAFAGHTDVVPAGDVQEWDSDPFVPEIRDGYLYGRGAADMKGSLAAMIVAVEQFVAAYPDHDGRIAFLITSDEEGVATHGTVKVVEALSRRGEKIDWCVVGEPSSTREVGDTIKNGRRGSLGGQLTVQGIQGHVAYPEKARNPIHQASAALCELTQVQWDQGNNHFPATSFQISNINSGTGATNVIPGTLEAVFNFRYSTEVTAEKLTATTESILARHGLEYQLTWNLSGLPFLTETGELVEATRTAIKSITGRDALLSTAGGTSDGRFIAPTGSEVIELGPCNDTIHKVNECVNVADLEQLALIYEQLIVALLC